MLFIEASEGIENPKRDDGGGPRESTGFKTSLDRAWFMVSSEWGKSGRIGDLREGE
ncbi:hypothetical protein PIB30_001980, partial [Stylosanthes scabra]|nr:hypothetical protein [Stylosanthes scabra]